MQDNKETTAASVTDSNMNIDAISPPVLTEIFDSFSEAVVVADTSRQIVYVNSATESLFGYSKDQLYGHETKILYADEHDFSEQGKKRFNPTSKISAETYRVAYQRMDGGMFLGLTTGSAMHSSEGALVGYIGIIRPARTSDQSLDTLQQVHAIASDVSLTDTQKIDAVLKVGLSHFGLEVAIQARIKGSEYLVEHCIDHYEQLTPHTTFDFSETYCAHTFHASGPIGFHFAGESEIRNHPCYRNFKLESYIGIPLEVDGKLYGTISFSGYSPTEPFCKDDYILMALLADTVSYIIYRKTVEDKLLELARTDELTGLANRRSTLERLREHAKLSYRSGGYLTVLSIDLDFFKKINDNWGHSAGDAALVGFADIAATLGRDIDFCGRMGGEEFIFVLPNTDSRGGVNLGNRLRERLAAAPIKLDNNESVTLSVSVGVAMLEKGESLESLLARADEATYAAKRGGRDRVCISELNN
ncbi:GGDEF domain-containing protein [Oceanisphaera profunda]|uniref:diguanylate cyclase n=1 Tax=Oceanisphaera profunda TaxID=1416627 RepID=A0A1Y0D2B3_9GAMM|nr:diguanylate cyclase [Oceanisphaera profunda]ART81367.1 GGDEF domain-containing protein [Oceanisphaera profunda]